MPATFSHPAAILPLRRWAPRWLDTTGLVIGSMAPDLGYFLLLFDGASKAHEPAGLLLLTLPSGLVVWGLLQLAWPTLSRVLPPAHATFLTGALLHQGPLGAAKFGRLALSVLLGGATHLLWDSFTHKQSWFVEALPALRTPIPLAFGFEAPGYYLLQHSCSLLGLVALVIAYRRAMAQVPALPMTRPAHWRPLLVLAGAAMLLGCAGALPVAADYEGSRAVRNFAFRSVVHSLALGLLFAWLRGLQLTRRERLIRAESNGSAG